MKTLSRILSSDKQCGAGFSLRGTSVPLESLAGTCGRRARHLIRRTSIILLFAGSLLAGPDPLLGTWKAIPGSNTSTTGPQNVVLRYEATDVAGEVKFTLSGERTGQPYSYTWAAKPD